MRVLHVIPSIDARYGGPSYAVRAMVRSQNEVGIRADIATTYKANNTGHKTQDVSDERQVIRNDIKAGLLFSFPSCLGEYKFSWGLWHWLSENVKNYDIVHIHSVFCFSTAMAAATARKAGIPYIVRPLGQLYPWALNNRNWLLKKAYLAIVENETLTHAAAIHFTAQNELKQSEIETDKARAYVLPLGIELPEEMSKGIAMTFYPELQNKKILLFLSRIHPKKGLDLVLPWLATLLDQRPDWIFVIAGDADSSDYLESIKVIVSRQKIQSQVVFTGQVTGDRKTSLYVLADLFLLPSHSENFGIVVVEALAAGVPVLVSDQVGLQDEISKNNAGLVFYLKETSFSDQVIRLMDDEGLRKTMSKNTQRLVRNKFNWSAITQQQKKYYEELLNRDICG